MVRWALGCGDFKGKRTRCRGLHVGSLVMGRGSKGLIGLTR